jgi:cystathionine beta-lyase
MNFDTKLVRFDQCPDDPYRPVATPIYQTATFEQECATEFGEYDYSRSGNPTRTVLEKQLALLENAGRAFCFSSGMAAIAAISRLVKPGEEILAGTDLYGGAYRLFSRILQLRGIGVRYAPSTSLAELNEAITPQTRLIHIETPGNPLLSITDIAAVAELAHFNGALLSVDNSMLSPYLQTPLDHGPFDSFLLLRGLKTLSLRLQRQQENALRIVDFLQRHPQVKRVFYPGWGSEQEQCVLEKQARGGGALVAFETGDVELSRHIAEQTKIFAITVSFGSVNSSISLPYFMSHSSIPPELREKSCFPHDLVRLSVGIEDAQDLIADLEQAFNTHHGDTEAQSCTDEEKLATNQ